MEFQGPSATDYANVNALNRAFLALLRRDGTARGCLRELREPLRDKLVGLTGVQADRLAGAPFLLMSFRERDDRFWEQAFADELRGDLFAVPPPAADDLVGLISAGLSFAWQLSKQNAYAARLICGASLHWCEQLTELTFMHLLSIAGRRDEIVALRGAADRDLWAKLLDSGTSREQQVRRAAHISALQSVLTQASLPAGRQWRTAACATRSPSLQIAEDDP
ncbi:MAG TPA: hypothetical protein VFG91_10630 [Woeseiaceae bacterium]|nr:hypothetical protein [Woeseiaceae bacterium]